MSDKLQDSSGEMLAYAFVAVAIAGTVAAAMFDSSRDEDIPHIPPPPSAQVQQIPAPPSVSVPTHAP